MRKMLATINRSTKSDVVEILSEPLVYGVTITSSVDSIENAESYKCFKNRRYFLDLYEKYYSRNEGKESAVKIKKCSQRFMSNKMLIYSELEIIHEGVSNVVVKEHLSIPVDTYLVQNMICIPELLRQLFSNPCKEKNTLDSVLKINHYQEGDSIWSL